MATQKKGKAAPAKGSLKKASKALPPKATKKQQGKLAVVAAKQPLKKKSGATPPPARKQDPVKASNASNAKAVAKPALPLKPSKRSTEQAVAVIRNLSRKPVKTVPVPAPVSKAPSKAAPKPAVKAAAPVEPKKPRFNANDLAQFRQELLAMRDRITGQSGSMRNDALQHSDEINPEEDGTDAFMRLQTLEQVSSQQQIITNIDESLRSIEKGTYGVCDMCGELINKPRLTVLPFAKNCIKCQSEMERSHRLGGRR